MESDKVMYAKGERVTHSTWGAGTVVISSEDEMSPSEVTIQFDDAEGKVMDNWGETILTVSKALTKRIPSSKEEA